MIKEDEDFEINIIEIDQMALEHWQDDLGKFFPTRKTPTYSEYNMFSAGYKAGYAAALVNKPRSAPEEK